MELTKYKPCLNPEEYQGFGYCFNTRDGKWYTDVAIFADDFSDGDVSAWNSTYTTNTYEGGLRIETDGTAGNYSFVSIDSLAIGSKYKVYAEVNIPSSNTVTNGAYIEIVSAGNQAYISNATNEGLYIFDTTFISSAEATLLGFRILQNGVAWGSAGDYITVKNVSLIPLNDDGSIDFSNAAEVVGGLGIVGKAYIDGNGGAESAEQLPRESYAEVYKAKRVECNELGFTPVVYSGYLASSVTSDSILNFTTVLDNTSSYLAGIFKCPEDGIYKVECTALLAISGSGEDAAVDIITNGSILSRVYALHNSVTQQGTSNSAVVRLSKNDTIYVSSFEVSGTAYVVGSANPYTTLVIQKIGE